jgi:hypothetical protein
VYTDYTRSNTSKVYFSWEENGSPGGGSLGDLEEPALTAQPSKVITIAVTDENSTKLRENPTENYEFLHERRVNQAFLLEFFKTNILHYLYNILLSELNLKNMENFIHNE